VVFHQISLQDLKKIDGVCRVDEDPLMATAPRWSCVTRCLEETT
jgi:hypothetical protein